MKSRLFINLNIFAIILALLVIVLGAYTRLSDAGLGCPDWPACYGFIGVPELESDVAQANLDYPNRPVEAEKAWKEMIHRYFAATLGLVIVLIAFIAVRRRRLLNQPVLIPVFLVALVIFQGLLGMWTVTLLLKPVIVMGHLLGGLSIISLLVWQLLRYHNRILTKRITEKSLAGLRKLALLALMVLVLQISLGGWTSANYAALSCPDFPKCQQQWFPSLNFSEAFVPWQVLSEGKTDYEGGVLNNESNVTIHFMHRVGAIMTFFVLCLLVFKLVFREYDPVIRRIALLLFIFLIAQIGLGISNVVLSLPLFIAVAHNAVAVLLLQTMVLLNHALRPKRV